MNVYEFMIWTAVRHNGNFSHNIERIERIHAMNEERARGKIILKETTQQMVGTLKLEASREYIYSTRRIGTVVKRMYYEYSDSCGLLPKPC